MTREVFVRLLNEGTPCSRPTQAEEVEGNLFRLLATADYDPDDEDWEVKPGSLVQLERQNDGSRDYWLAVAAER